MNEDIHDKWADVASELPDVFRRPTISPQGSDGVGHFNYYDRERALSFQWDGDYNEHVTVSHGGYGEAVKWTFDFKTIWAIGVADFIVTRQNGEPKITSFSDAANHFRSTCDKWIEQFEVHNGFIEGKIR